MATEPTPDTPVFDIEEFVPSDDHVAAKEAALLVLDQLVSALARHHHVMKAEARLIIREAVMEL